MAGVEPSEGRPAVAPIPVSIACRAVGLVPERIADELRMGQLPELQEAMARGRILCVRQACGTGPEARQWAWLAERLAPRELHLPTRITGVAPEDGGAPLAVQAVTVTLAAARLEARDDVAPLALPGPPRALPDGGDGPEGGEP